MNEENNLTGVAAIIPMDILKNKSISHLSKFVYALITGLSLGEKNIYGCYASDEYFAKILNTSSRTIQNSLKELETNKLIKREFKITKMFPDGRRYISIHWKFNRK